MTIEQAVPGQLRTIGSIAAENLTKQLNLPETATCEIEHAIADEIHALSAHFTLMVADVQTHFESEALKAKAAYEDDLAVIKSEFTYLAANPGKVAIAVWVLLIAGILVGHFA